MKPFVRLLLILGWFFFQAFAVAEPAAAEIDGPGVQVPILGHGHIQTILTPHEPYNSNPPTSGPHIPFVARWGIHKTPIPKEGQVHNLEDGGVVIQYNCTPQSCGELIAKLEGLVTRYLEKALREKLRSIDPGRPTKYEHLIVAPYPDMDTTVALTAWGRIDKLNSYDEDRIVRFIEAYAGIDHHPIRK
jgi:hypothetical protein